MSVKIAEKWVKVANKTFPLRDDYVWALLRNLKVLTGLRVSDNDKPIAPPRSFIAGRGAHLLAKRMATLEPTLSCDVRFDSDIANGSGRDDDSMKEVIGGAFDCTIVTQPHQFLLDREHVTSLRKTLHPEKGIAGFVWVRLANSSVNLPWIQAFTTAALQSGGNSGGGGKGKAITNSSTSLSTFRNILQNESPMEYFDNELNLPLSGFKPPVHRKFVESITGPKKEIFRLIQLSHDIYRPGMDYEVEFEALKLGGDGNEISTIDLDIHLFFAQQQQQLQQTSTKSTKSKSSPNLV
jgi:hypothetical protein